MSVLDLLRPRSVARPAPADAADYGFPAAPVPLEDGIRFPDPGRYQHPGRPGWAMYWDGSRVESISI